MALLLLIKDIASVRSMGAEAPCGALTANEAPIASQPRSRRALRRSCTLLLLLLLLLYLLWLLRCGEPWNHLPQSMLLLHS